jgi:antitoxin PrlF
MRKLARITSKGQVTVPHEIRRALGVGPGDKLEFEKEGSVVRVRPVRAQSPFEKYRGIGNPNVPTGKKAMLRYFRNMRGR